jgi:hypothetical protein
MAKIPLNQFSKELVDALEKAKKEITSSENLQKIGSDLAEQIKVRTRLGNGLAENGGEPDKLRPLSEPYIKERKVTQLSQFTTAKKSNLTLTGQMLDEIVAKIANGIITITFKSQESKDKARWNTDKGRPFLSISRVQIERLTNALNKQLSEAIKKYLK